MNIKRIMTDCGGFLEFDLLLGRTSPILLTLSHNPPALILRIGNNQCDGKFISDSLQREIITSFPRMNKQTRKETSFQIHFYSPWTQDLELDGNIFHCGPCSLFFFPHLLCRIAPFKGTSSNCNCADFLICLCWIFKRMCAILNSYFFM